MSRNAPQPRRIAVLLAGCLLLGGCGFAVGSNDSSSAGAPEAAVAEPAEGAARSAGAPAQEAAGAPSKEQDAADAALAPDVQLVRTGEITVQVDSLATSVAKVRATAAALGGQVASETTALGQGADVAGAEAGSGEWVAPGQSVVVLRVPVASFEAAMDKVAAVGEERSRSSTSQDVTADLVDLRSREATAQASVTRVRALLAEATSLQDVVLLESELTRREADLEALQARRAALADRAALSTITATLQTPAVEPQDEDSFGSGLRSGWDAFVASTKAVVQVIGALIPWMVVLAAVGWPLVVFVRRRRGARRRPSGQSPAA